MGWAMLIKGLQMMSVKQKVQEITAEEIYKKAVFAPVAWLGVTAPGLFLLIAVSLSATSAVVQFYPQYFFASDFALTLGGVSLLGSVVTYLIYQRLLKIALVKVEAMRSPSNEDHVQDAVSPVTSQFKKENAMLMASIRAKKPKSEQLPMSSVQYPH